MDNYVSGLSHLWSRIFPPLSIGTLALAFGVLAVVLLFLKIVDRAMQVACPKCGKSNPSISVTCASCQFQLKKPEFPREKTSEDIYAQRILFVLFLLTAPSPIYAFVAMGFLPPIAMFIGSFNSVAGAIILVPHLALYVFAYYHLSGIFLESRTRSGRRFSFSIVTLILFILPFFPIYGVSHNKQTLNNWIGLWKPLLS